MRSDEKQTIPLSCLEESSCSHAAHDDSRKGGSRDRSTDLQAFDIGGVVLLCERITTATADPWLTRASASAHHSRVTCATVPIEPAKSVHFRACVFRAVNFFPRQSAGPFCCGGSGGEGSGENSKGSGTEGHHLESRG